MKSDDQKIKTGKQVPESDDTLGLLLSSVPPPAPTEVDEDDAGAVIPASTISGLEQEIVRNGSAVVEALRQPRRRSRFKIGIALAVGALLASGAVSVGAVSWSQQSAGPGEADVAAEREALELHRALSERDRELLALRAAHLEEINSIKARLADLRAGGATADSSSVSELETRLEETLAQSAEVELAAQHDSLLVDRSERHRRRAGTRASAASGAASPQASYQAVEDNPYGDYDGVSSATNLNSHVWESAAAKEKKERAVAEARAVPARRSPEPANEIEELLESAIDRPQERVSGAARSSGPITGDLPDDQLPPKPSRQEVKQVMDRIAGLVRRCGGDAYSRLTVQLAVAGNTGRVTRAQTIDGEYAGTTIGNCAARAVRAAKFPRFAQQQLVIKYPFDL